jgi:very-short-patch-repair endonuclease
VAAWPDAPLGVLMSSDDKPERWRTSETMMASARLLRQEQTRAEAVLWDALRDRRLAGLKFRRQHALRWCVVDFYCPEHHLAIEVDGPLHLQQQDQDRARDERLALEGIRVLRVTNDQVLHALDATLQFIDAAVQDRQMAGGA